MIVFLNKSFIAEQAVLVALKSHFLALGIADYYKNVSVNVTNRHPFAQCINAQMQGSTFQSSLFPAVVVAELSDEKPAELANLCEGGGLSLDSADMEEDESGKTAIERAGFEVFPKTTGIAALKAKIAADGQCLALNREMPRRSRVSIEVWSENLQMKNELYEFVRLFCGCTLLKALQKNFEHRGLNVFDVSIRGERSNNANVDFGVTLWGAILEVEIDYVVEQICADTDASIPDEIGFAVKNYALGVEKPTETEF